MEPINDSDELKGLIARAVAGDASAASKLVGRYRDRLRLMVAIRLDRRLQTRIDVSDAVQEVLTEAAGSFRDYVAAQPMDFFLWLRRLACNRLCSIHCEHLGTFRRDAGEEISLFRAPMPQASSHSLAQQLLGRMTPLHEPAVRAELQLVVQEILNSLDPTDREVLVLRSLERLSNGEAAEVLGIERSAASKRYVEALKRLNQAINAIPGLKPASR